MKPTVANITPSATANLFARFAKPQLRPLCLAAAMLFVPFTAAQPQNPGNEELEKLLFDAVWLPATNPTEPSGTAGAGTTTDDSAQTAGPVVNADLDSDADKRQSISAYEAAIYTLEEEEGLYSDRLKEQYQSLGLLQQQTGQHEEAISTFEKAVHIERVNKGLHTIEQIADIKNIIRSLNALGDEQREMEYRNYIYTIVQKSFEPGDPQLLAAMEEWADWNLQQYQLSAGANPNYIQLPGSSKPEEFITVRDTRTGNAYFLPRKFVSGEGIAASIRYAVMPELIIDERLDTARDTLEDMLEEGDSTLEQENKDSIRLKLVAAEYALKRQMDNLLGAHDRGTISRSSPIRSERDLSTVNRGLRNSVDYLQTLIDEQQNAADVDPLALAQAYINLGDFQLAYQQQSKANKAYAQAWLLLGEANLSPTDFNNVLAPDPLTPIPAFAAAPYSREILNIPHDDLIEYRGYIDATMDISRNGNVRRIKVIDASEGTPYKVRSKLLEYLKHQRMRPALPEGKTTQQKDLRIRFYYTY